ncbi:threonine aldolase [Candidatus Saccharibacteria bacterium]|nr:threonine aldolase [Candidatus Saccharibacteria bacterium]
MKYSFYDDYSEGVHPEILKYISENNLDSQLTYGRDEYSKLAAERVKKEFDVSSADIHFLPTGTVCNVVALKSMLRPIEGVISPSSGHINTHETGALEAHGHKIIWVDTHDGKLTPALIDKALSSYEDEHTVIPKVVYLTQVTELGTVYTNEELRTVINYARAKGLYTFLDGARLAMAVASEAADMSTRDIGSFGLDIFSIGGTKNGGMFGEALVIQNETFKKDFRYFIKQRGGMVAKGRFIGQQFARFFDDDRLWLNLAVHANEMAKLLYQGMKEVGVEFDLAADANQVFPILDNEVYEKLGRNYGFYPWSEMGSDKTKVRFVCSWSTTREQVESLITDTKALL